MTELEVKITPIGNDNFYITTSIPISFGELYSSLDDCFCGASGFFELSRISESLIKIKFSLGSYEFWYNRDKVEMFIKKHIKARKSDINIVEEWDKIIIYRPIAH
jgi:hypothetical protein